MNGALDLLIVLLVTAAAVLFAFLSLAPRPWRSRLLRMMAAAAMRLGMRGPAARLGGAAARNDAAGGCGSCGDCGSGKSAGGADVHVPLSAVKRRR